MARGIDSGRHPNRQVGRSELPRLTSLITNNLTDESIDKTVFLPDFTDAVSARLSNYRAHRNTTMSKNKDMSPLNKDTAREVNERFSNRHSGGYGSYK